MGAVAPGGEWWGTGGMAGSAADTGSLWDRARGYVYDRAIVSFTKQWYRAVLEDVPEGSRVLDVGIGTGAALVANASLLRNRNLYVVGVDYDDAYVRRCRELVREAALQDRVSVVCESIYDYVPSDNALFDHVYFSGSFMILPMPAAALRKVVELLRDREVGKLFFTQTFELQKNTMLEWLKPKLMSVTSIDFGSVTYDADFDDAVFEGGLVVEHSAVLDDGKRVDGVRESRLVIARSRIYVPDEKETVS